MRTLEERITRTIWKHTAGEWLELSKVDVVVVGAGGLAGMTATKYLADKGFKVIVFERRLSFGGALNPKQGHSINSGNDVVNPIAIAISRKV